MIFDKISAYKNYLGISKYLDKALETIATTDFSKFENGRHEICDGVFFNKFEADTKTYGPTTKWEVHHDYLDVHVPLKGSEKIGYCAECEADQTDAYDPSCDAAFYTKSGDANLCTVRNGEFMVCFPSDIHAPTVANGEPSKVEKVVFKVKVG